MQDDEEQMFVDIENFKSVLAIENLLIPYKRGRLAPDKKSYLPKEPITLDICWEVLKSTNAPRSIKDMLSCIADLPPSQQAQFKEVVLSTFIQREQPNTQPHNIVLLGKKLAAASGYETEFVEAQKIKEGTFLFSALQLSKGFITFENSFSDVDFSSYDKLVCLSHYQIDFKAKVQLPENLVFPNSSHVVFKNCDMKNSANLSFNDGAKVTLFNVTNLPKNLDLSQCSEVVFSWCDLSEQENVSLKDGTRVFISKVTKFPSSLDFSHCSYVSISDCNLKSLGRLSLGKNAEVFLNKAQDLPPQLDFSQCSKVTIYGGNFSNQSRLCFAEKSVVHMDDVGGLPEVFEASQSSYLELHRCNLKEVKSIVLADDVHVDLSRSINLPPNIDFSRCSYVSLFDCNLCNQNNLLFQKDAAVDLRETYNLPSQLDVSPCLRVYLEQCNLKNVKCLTFKNRSQMKDSDVKLPDDWKGKVVYTDTALSKFRALFNKGR